VSTVLADPLGKSGQVTAKSDPLGQITSYQYNANGWLTREVKADGQAVDYRWETYRCDAAGNGWR